MNWLKLTTLATIEHKYAFWQNFLGCHITRISVSAIFSLKAFCCCKSEQLIIYYHVQVHKKWTRAFWVIFNGFRLEFNMKKLLKLDVFELKMYKIDINETGLLIIYYHALKKWTRAFPVMIDDFSLDFNKQKLLKFDVFELKTYKININLTYIAAIKNWELTL